MKFDKKSDSGYIRNMNSMESKLHSEIDKKFIETIDVLSYLQGSIRSSCVIQNNGLIQGIPRVLSNNPIIDNKQKEALRYRNDPDHNWEGCIDIKIILGAIVCTYDSSIYNPIQLNFTARGTKKCIEQNNETISLIGIDINPSHRKDSINPTTTLHHELQHHLNTIVGDSLLYSEFGGKYPSLERNSDRFIFQGKYNSRSQLTENDARLIESFFGKNINLKSTHPAIKTQDYMRYENQLYYFDELSAHYGQLSSMIFGPKMDFYNNRMNGNHYEIIGNHPDDIKDLQDLYRDYIMPSLYITELINSISRVAIRENHVGTIIKGWNKGEWEKYIHKLRMIQIKITQILGVSRSVYQAKTLMKNFWEKSVTNKADGIRPSDIEWLKNCGKQQEKYI